MGLGQRFWQWLDTTPLGVLLKTYRQNVLKRRDEIVSGDTAYVQSLWTNGEWNVLGMYILYLPLYTFTGFEIFKPRRRSEGLDNLASEAAEFAKDPQDWMQKKLREFGTSPATIAFTEFVGTIITEPVLGILETYSAQENPDPHDMARAFHGIASGLPFAASQVDNLLKIPLGDRAPNVGQGLMGLYWGLGLGFLGWQTLAPLLSAGLQPNLERYYNKLYKPARFNPGQMRDLFALGRVNAAEFQQTMRETGWRDQDIEKWLAIAYRDLGESQVFDAWQQGFIDQSQVETRLRALGYRPEDIPLIIKLNPREDEAQAPKFLLSTAKAAFKAKKISADEFRQILTAMKYADREIELQIQLLTTEKDEEDRDLTTAQIKELYNNRIIGRDEVQNGLVQIRYRPDVAEQLIKAWDNESLPKAARINRGTITEGYVNGALSRSEALNLLQKEAGYSSQNAELVLKIEEASLKQRDKPSEGQGTAVSISQLTAFAQNGLITRAEMETRQELARFEATDRAKIIELMFQAPVLEPVELGPEALLDAYRLQIITIDVLRQRLAALGLPATDIEILIASQQARLSPSLLSQAYVSGLVARSDFLSRLQGVGLSADDAELFVRTVELENPAVFGEFTAQFIKRPQVGSLQLALQRGLIDEAGFRDRLSQQGYSQDAIEIYLFNAQYQAPASPKSLTKSEILGLYQDEKFTRQQALQRLIQLGYTIEDATLLVEQKAQLPQDTEIGQAYISGLIDQFGAASFLTDYGFTVDQIDEFFGAVERGEL